MDNASGGLVTDWNWESEGGDQLIDTEETFRFWQDFNQQVITMWCALSSCCSGGGFNIWMDKVRIHNSILVDQFSHLMRPKLHVLDADKYQVPLDQIPAIARVISIHPASP